MSDVTRILSAIDQGDPHAAERLLPLVYDELRQLAAKKMARENPGQTLQATALVHEAFLRLVKRGDASAPREQHWDSSRHFFSAAAEAMRRILVERARRKGAVKRGGGRSRMDLDQIAVPGDEHSLELLALDEAIKALEQHDPQAAELVKLRFFGGLKHQEAADTLGITRRAADRIWAVARAWLYQHIGESE